MSFFDAYVGTGGTYTKVSDAINDGKQNICVLSFVQETAPWLLTLGDYQNLNCA